MSRWLNRVLPIGLVVTAIPLVVWGADVVMDAACRCCCPMCCP